MSQHIIIALDRLMKRGRLFHRNIHRNRLFYNHLLLNLLLRLLLTFIHCLIFFRKRLRLRFRPVFSCHCKPMRKSSAGEDKPADNKGCYHKKRYERAEKIIERRHDSSSGITSQSSAEGSITAEKR